jgi:membrane protein implicated in regulation of membrane protease activity
VLGTIALLAPVVVASWISTWLGVVVFVALSALVIWRLVAGRRTNETVPAERADVDDTPER